MRLRRLRGPRGPRARPAVPLGAAGPGWAPGAALAAGLAVAAAQVGGTAWELANAAPADTALPPGTATTGGGRWGLGRLYTLGLVPLFLATPFFARATFRREVVPGRVWSFEQKQGIGLGLNTSLNVRMTVLRLSEGGLFVYGEREGTPCTSAAPRPRLGRASAAPRPRAVAED